MHPSYPFKTISCQFIDHPDTFIRSLHDSPDSLLVDRLQLFGQTVPLLVWQQAEKQYQLIACYSSFTAITSLGIKKVTCQVLPLSTPPILLYSLQILHGLMAPQASPILQAYLLQQARNELTDKETFSLLSLMGHKPQRYKLDELIDLLRLSPSAVVALHRGILSPKTGKLFKLLSHEDQELLVRLISTYQLGGSKQQKLVEMVTELSLRENKPVQILIREWLPAADQTFVEENAPQRFERLLQTLYELYWPEKSTMEKNFQQLVQGLQIPEGVTIKPSPSFEDEGVEMRLRFANIEALKEKWRKMKTIFRRP
jgi:ParB family transcriptional regulator, chromosome partitioning protein